MFHHQKLSQTVRFIAMISITELSRLRGLPIDKLGAEIEELRREATRVTAETTSDSMNSQSNWTLKTIWAQKSLRWPFVCVMVMHFGNQMSGINAVSLTVNLKKKFF